MNFSPFSGLAPRLEQLLTRIEHWLPPAPGDVDWSAPAYRWRSRGGLMAHGWLEPILKPHRIRLDDLQGIDEQKQRIAQNTRQFVAGHTANNVLLTGARGTGKSSLVKAVLDAFMDQGLRLIEVDKDDLVHLPDIVAQVARRPEKFIIFCDDLSFEQGEASYKALKSVLDGSLSGVPQNVLIYATSNRRHLMPEFMAENLEARQDDRGELRPGDTTEEKISLSERFGLWLSFYPVDQDTYLAICAHWLAEFGVAAKDIANAEGEALRWALGRGSRSGRVAWQFARDYAGQLAAGSAGKPPAAKAGVKLSTPRVFPSGHRGGTAVKRRSGASK